MLKNKRLKEAIGSVGMVNNLDSQDFDKKSVGTAPISYADAVLRARKRKEACKKAYEDQVEVARRTLKKEVSNEEHPEPLGKIRGNKERKMTLDEGLFESLEDEHLGKVKLKEWMPSHAVWVKKDGKWKPYSALDFDTLSDEEVAAFKGLGYDDVKLLPNDGSEPDEVVESVVCPKCGKEPCACKVEESLFEESQDHKDIVATNLVRRYYQGSMSLEQLHRELLRVFDGDIKRAFEFLLNFGKKKVEESLYPEYVSYQGKKMRVQGIRLNGKYALSEPKYSGLDITKRPEYLIDVDKDEVETIEECVHSEIKEGAEEKKVYRVTYKHSPQVFSSVMVKAANEDEAKQKLAVKEPGKDIVGVSVMSDYEVSDMTNRGMSLMEAKVVDDFSSYEPWGAAVSTFDNIQNAGKMDALEQLIDDMYPNGVDKTELNDLLAFESDWVYSMLNMSNEENVNEEEDGLAIDFDEEE